MQTYHIFGLLVYVFPRASRQFRCSLQSFCFARLPLSLFIMARLHFLSGPIALIALAGVNAGPCRPSSSAATTITGLETTATMSTDIGDTTTVLFTSLAVTDSTETLTVTLSASETRNTETAVATTTAGASDSTTVMATDTATATADATTTTMAATTSAAPAEACHGLSREYIAPQGTTFDIECGRRPTGSVRIIGAENASDFKTCVNFCDGNQFCLGAIWFQDSKTCLFVDSFDGTEAMNGDDFAKVTSRST
jgi:hypothetical protein